MINAPAIRGTTGSRSFHAVRSRCLKAMTPDDRKYLSIGSGLPRSGCRAVRFLQLLRALLTTHLDRLAADLHFDGARIQLAVACRTGLLDLHMPSTGP